MAYFLKKSKQAKFHEKGLYLQIYESFHDPIKKISMNRSFKKIGYVQDLIDSGIGNPIEYYQNEVDKLNKKRKVSLEAQKALRVTDSKEKNVGYFICKSMIDKLELSDLNYFDLVKDSPKNIYDIVTSLIYCRIINPVSKLKTYEEVLPYLYQKYTYSKDTMYDGINFIGEHYEQIIELFNKATSKIYKRKTGQVYFDCTNYYFEIDYEKNDQQKGPSKELRTDPIIGMALMLDENQIPLAMKMYPGNESEKPKLREMIEEMKKQQQITGKSIHVADKGLNCAENISNAILNHDGYIFSKSLKQSTESFRNWALSDLDKFKVVKNEDGSIDYMYKYIVNEFSYSFTDINGKRKTITLPEKRVVSFNPSLQKKKLYEINKLVEKAKDLSLSHAKKSEYGDAASYVTFSSVNKKTGELSDDDTVVASLNFDKINLDKKLAGFNLLVSSEVNMDSKDIYRIYHNLWRIEDSFRILKSQLNARPVFLQKPCSIYGHFLICYLSLLILRLLQFKTFNDKCNMNDIISFIRNFRIVRIDDNSNFNLATFNDLNRIESLLNCDCSRLYLPNSLIDKLFKFKI